MSSISTSNTPVITTTSTSTVTSTSASNASTGTLKSNIITRGSVEDHFKLTSKLLNCTEKYKGYNLFYRIFNALKALAGRSDWQKAGKTLNAKICVAFMDMKVKDGEIAVRANLLATRILCSLTYPNYKKGQDGQYKNNANINDLLERAAFNSLSTSSPYSHLNRDVVVVEDEIEEATVNNGNGSGSNDVGTLTISYDPSLHVVQAPASQETTASIQKNPSSVEKETEAQSDVETFMAQLVDEMLANAAASVVTQAAEPKEESAVAQPKADESVEKEPTQTEFEELLDSTLNKYAALFNVKLAYAESTDTEVEGDSNVAVTEQVAVEGEVSKSETNSETELPEDETGVDETGSVKAQADAQTGVAQADAEPSETSETVAITESIKIESTKNVLVKEESNDTFIEEYAHAFIAKLSSLTRWVRA